MDEITALQYYLIRLRQLRSRLTDVNLHRSSSDDIMGMTLKDFKKYLDDVDRSIANVNSIIESSGHKDNVNVFSFNNKKYSEALRNLDDDTKRSIGGLINRFAGLKSYLDNKAASLNPSEKVLSSYVSVFVDNDLKILSDVPVRPESAPEDKPEKKREDDPLQIRLRSLLERLERLENENSSQYMKDMVQSLRKVVKAPYSEFAAGNEQLTKDLSMCELACVKYLDTHKSRPFFKNGRDRVSIAKELKGICSDFTSKSWEVIARNAESEKELYLAEDKRLYDEALEAKEAKELEELEKNGGRSNNTEKKPEWMTDDAIDRLVKISKLQNVVQPMNFRPSMHREVRTTGFWAKIHGFVGKVVSGVQWVVNSIADTFMDLTDERFPEGPDNAKDPSGPNNDDEILETMKEVLPGIASSLEIDTETKDASGTYLDHRRIPLIWAKEILEDPDQDIELTVNVKQAIDGSDASMGASKNGRTDRNAPDKWGMDPGHGFFTLKYSKVDPITGVKRRYQTKFGFGGGEYVAKADSVNMYLNSAMIQGAIHNDDDCKTSIGRSFKITPDQFNKLVDFAQEYPKGGYNLMSRNCCTFLADACKKIGLKEAENLFVEGDTTFSGLAATGVALGGTIVTLFDAVPGLNPAFRGTALKNASKYRATPSYSYQKFGQALVTADDIRGMQINKGIQTLHGMAPGAIGERIRSGYGQSFHSNRYAVNARSNDPSDQKNYAYTYSLKHQSLALINAVKKRMMPVISKIKDRKQRAAEQKHLQKIVDTITFNYETIGGSIDKGFRYLHDSKDLPMKEIRRACMQINRLADHFRDVTLDLFNNALKSDDSLNMEFTRMISTIERVNEKTQNWFEKRSLWTSRNLKYSTPDLGDHVDTGREAVGSLMGVLNMKHNRKNNTGLGRNDPKVGGGVEFNGSGSSPFSLLAIYEGWDSLKDYMDDPVPNKYGLVYDLEKACAQKADPNIPFTDRDIRMILIQMPKDEKTFSDFTGTGLHASDVLKGLLFEKYFTGFADIVKDRSEKFVKLDFPVKESAMDPKKNESFDKAKSFYTRMMFDSFGFIDNKLKTDGKAKAAFEKMVGFQEESLREDPKNNAPGVDLRKKSEMLIKLEIFNTLIAPQIGYRIGSSVNTKEKLAEISGGKLTNPDSVRKAAEFADAIEGKCKAVYDEAKKIINAGSELTGKTVYSGYKDPHYEVKLETLIERKSENPLNINNVNNKYNIDNVNNKYDSVVNNKDKDAKLGSGSIIADDEEDLSEDEQELERAGGQILIEHKEEMSEKTYYSISK